MPTTAYLSSEGGYADDMESIENQMIIARREKKLVKTIEEVLDGLKCCEKLICNSFPFDGDENCKSTLLVEARRAMENIIFDNERKSKSVTELIKELNEAHDANRALRVELSANLKHKTTSDMVNHPPHYESGKYECIDVMEEVYGTEIVKNFCLCNAFKYLYRCMHKHDSPTEDTKKSAWYLEKYFELGDRSNDD